MLSISKFSALAPVGLFIVSASASAQTAPTAARRAPESLPGRVVEVSAGEFYFRSPDTIPAGLTTFRLRQVGEMLTHPAKVEAENMAPASAVNDPTRAFHMLWVVRLENGRTATDLYNAEAKDEPTPWAVTMGGPASARPPGSSNATLLLEPGNYALVCYVGSAREDKSRYHLLKGMYRGLTVLPVKTAAGSLPRPDVVARITGTGQVALSGPVKRGRQVIRVINETAKMHEFIVARVKEGRTSSEVPTWRRPDGTARPFDSNGGLSDVPAGATLTTTIVFEPGSYVFWTVRAPATSVAVTIPGGSNR